MRKKSSALTLALFIGFSLSPLSSEIKVLEADMLDLPFSNECFDVVIEKGTMVNLQFTMALFQPAFIYSCF